MWDTIAIIVALALFVAFHIALWFIEDVWLGLYSPPDSISWWLKPLAIYVRTIRGIRTPAERREDSEGR